MRLPMVVKTEAEWKLQLSPESFYVTRQEGTERAFSGKYADNHADGLYRCICCDTALFDSKTKFESGTGWPSFWQPISAMNVTKTTDSTLGVVRDAISCTLCAAHLGHVFNDGPEADRPSLLHELGGPQLRAAGLSPARRADSAASMDRFNRTIASISCLRDRARHVASSHAFQESRTGSGDVPRLSRLPVRPSAAPLSAQTTDAAILGIARDSGRHTARRGDGRGKEHLDRVHCPRPRPTAPVASPSCSCRSAVPTSSPHGASGTRRHSTPASRSAWATGWM